MATLVQLQAEPWWGREIVTDELDWLGDELCRRTGRPRIAAGSKGDVAHMRGAHRSQEWIVNSVFCTNRAYTVQPGLTGDQLRHIAGFDFTPGSADQMIAQCRRLDAALRAGLLEEVREFYGNVDGDQVVDGWDNIRNRPTTSDSSHLWHWHISIDRRHLTNRALMERIARIALGDEEDDMFEQTDRDKLNQVHSLLTSGSRGAGLAETAGGGVPIANIQRQFWEVDNATATLAQAVARIEQRLGEMAARDTSAPVGQVTTEQLAAVVNGQLREVFADAGRVEPTA